MHLVVIAYPYHYHIAQLAIRKAQELLRPRVTTVLWDDSIFPEYGYDNFKNNFLGDMGHRTGIIPFSAWPKVSAEPRGWIRQQLAKLNVHNYLSGDEWVVMDGDTIINEDIEPTKFCYVNPGDPATRWHDWFTDYLLDLDNVRLTLGNRIATSSSVPIKRIQRSTLVGLANRIHELHGCDLSAVYHSFTLKQNRSKYLEMSEWEILTYYEAFCNKLLPLKEAAPKFLSPTDFVSTHEQFPIAVLDGHDNLPLEWFSRMGIQVNSEILNVVYPLTTVQKVL